MDAMEVRRRNVIRTYPYQTIAGLRFESGSSAQALEAAAEILDLPKLCSAHAELRKQGIYRGVGFAALVEHSALGPRYFESRGGDKSLSYETATVRAEPDGQVTLLVGTHSHGQGHETTFAQVAADELELPVDQVTVRFGDTAMVPYGYGTWASRSLVYAGGATILACGDVKRKAIQIAAHTMEQPLDALDYVDGAVVVRGAPARRLTFNEIARVAYHKAQTLPDDIDPGLEATRRYRAPDPGSFSNSLHAAVVEVDIRTGAVTILRYVVVEDCGRVVNPLIVDGQVIGGIAQGIGQAFLEEAHYDEDGQPTATTLADYLLPTACDVPRVEIHHIESPSPHSLGGFKGTGEGGAVNPPAALANAITDALTPFGIKVDHLPITPEWIALMLAKARAC
jgi:carbon-monoxide dehydrogenase large subunit